MGNDSDVDLFNPVGNDEFSRFANTVFPDSSIEPPFLVKGFEVSGSDECSLTANGQSSSFRSGGLTVKELQRQINGGIEDTESDLSTPLTSSCEEPAGNSALDVEADLLASSRGTFIKPSLEDEVTDGQKILKNEPKHMFILRLDSNASSMPPQLISMQ